MEGLDPPTVRKIVRQLVEALALGHPQGAFALNGAGLALSALAGRQKKSVPQCSAIPGWNGAFKGKSQRGRFNRGLNGCAGLGSAWWAGTIILWEHLAGP